MYVKLLDSAREVTRYPNKQANLAIRVPTALRASVALILVAFISFVSRAEQFPVPGLAIEPGRFPSAGQFEIRIITINTLLTGGITCDKNVTISPSGLPLALPNRQITPAFIDIPTSLPPVMEVIVTCRAFTKAGVFPFTISEGWQDPCQWHLPLHDGDGARLRQPAHPQRSQEAGGPKIRPEPENGIQKCYNNP